MLRPGRKYRPYTRKHLLRFTVEVRGPKGEKQFEKFRKELSRLLKRFKAKMSTKKRTPKK